MCPKIVFKPLRFFGFEEGIEEYAFGKFGVKTAAPTVEQNVLLKI